MTNTTNSADVVARIVQDGGPAWADVAVAFAKLPHGTELYLRSSSGERAEPSELDGLHGYLLAQAAQVGGGSENLMRRWARAVSALAAAPAAAQPSAWDRFTDPLIQAPAPKKDPCGECHIQPGEACDICGAKGATQDSEQRSCNNEACGWKGTTNRMLGSIGPLCPECGETTEQDSEQSEDLIDEAGYALLSEIAGIDNYDCNLRDCPAAYEALDRYRAAVHRECATMPEDERCRQCRGTPPAPAEPRAQAMTQAGGVLGASLKNQIRSTPLFSCHLERDFGKAPCDRDCGKLRCMHPSTPAPEARDAVTPGMRAIFDKYANPRYSDFGALVSYDLHPDHVSMLLAALATRPPAPAPAVTESAAPADKGAAEEAVTGDQEDTEAVAQAIVQATFSHCESIGYVIEPDLVDDIVRFALQAAAKGDA